MPDREKVIKGLEHCVEKLDTVVNKTHGFNCTTCPYFSKCDRSGYLIGLPLMHDALALLKAQEPRVMTLGEAKSAYVVEYRSGKMREVGSALLDLDVDPLNAEYGNIYRVWTSRPTDEQREATPWE